MFKPYTMLKTHALKVPNNADKKKKMFIINK